MTKETFANVMARLIVRFDTFGQVDSDRTRQLFKDLEEIPDDGFLRVERRLVETYRSHNFPLAAHFLEAWNEIKGPARPEVLKDKTPTESDIQTLRAEGKGAIQNILAGLMLSNFGKWPEKQEEQTDQTDQPADEIDDINKTTARAVVRSALRRRE